MIKKNLIRIKIILNLFIGKVKYFIDVFFKKPHFSIYLYSKQNDSIKISKFASIIDKRKILEENITLLEVGCYAGQSTIEFAKVLSSKFYNYHIFCLDKWKGYFSINDCKTNWTYRYVNKNLNNGNVKKLFFHNIESAKISEKITTIVGSNEKILKILPKNYYNIIYLDASHYYEEVLTNLKDCEKLIKEKGIIMGDDFELSYNDIDQDFARQNLDKDFIIDPLTSSGYHVGVTTALYDFYGDKVFKDGNLWYINY